MLEVERGRKARGYERLAEGKPIIPSTTGKLLQRVRGPVAVDDPEGETEDDCRRDVMFGFEIDKRPAVLSGPNGEQIVQRVQDDSWKNRTCENGNQGQQNTENRRRADSEKREVEKPEDYSDCYRQQRRPYFTTEPVEKHTSKRQFLHNARNETNEKVQLPRRNILRH